MGKRKVNILEPAATSVAEIAWFIENKGLPQTAKKFVNEVFLFFEKLSNEKIEHRPFIVLPQIAAILRSMKCSTAKNRCC